jgi:hypothetical protein
MKKRIPTGTNGKFTLDQKLAELERELGTRKRVYPEWQRSGRITKDVAEYRLLILEAIIADLAEWKEINEGKQSTLL